jgi:hypothetical protein|tara:strand:- start:311 stop:472 length:162 start_codon:yes stop_codon:yes gene_type:complete
MRSKDMFKNLKKALEQDYLYNSEELEFMREQLSVLEQEMIKSKRKKPQGFGKK